MNILMICHKSPLGAYARSHAMGRQLVRRHHNVTLILVSEKERWHVKEYNWDGVRAIETPHFSFGRVRYGWDAWNTFRRLILLEAEKTSYELVHCFETRPASIYPARWFSRKKRIPLITDWNDWCGRGGLVEINRPQWYHLLKLSLIETYYEEAFRASADGLTVISTALGKRAVTLGVRPERICHIPGGTFLDWFVLRSKEECRERIGFPLKIPIMGFSSSDSHFDLEIVMQALAKVAQVFPSIKLLVTGKAHQRVYEMVDKYHVESQVVFVGYLPFEELPWYLGCADLFLLPMADLPYNRGRWPNKMGEYMSLGRPTVANPVGDVKTLFENYEVGQLANWSPDDFAEKIIGILKNPDLAAEYGRVARDVAETEYDWCKIIGKLEKFYFKICDQKNKLIEKSILNEGLHGKP